MLFLHVSHCFIEEIHSSLTISRVLLNFLRHLTEVVMINCNWKGSGGDD